ncbi:MAG: PKD domain-containing protein [bacterium]
MRKYFVLLLGVILFTGTTLSLAQEHILMITYGPEARTAEGDDDFKQIIFFQVPQAVSDSLFLRIFDADCGGIVDSPFGDYDTKTRFQLFGGDAAYSSATVRNSYPNAEDIRAGSLIMSEEIGVDAFKDNKWVNFAHFSPTSGEAVDGNYVFKLVVEGLNGNDGNIFNVAVSLNDKRNSAPEGLRVFSYAPTVRLPSTGIFAEMRFFVPDAVEEITIHNFDLARGKVGVETAFRSNLGVVPSGQDEWAESSVQLEEKERNRLCAVIFEGGTEIPNDASFYVTDTQDKTLPIRLPMYVRTSNNRPVPRVDLKTLSDGYTVIFDGSRSTDNDGDALAFFWDFGDGQTGEGVRIAHTFDERGHYRAELIVSDASGQVGNSALTDFAVIVNDPPKAEAGLDLTGSPGQTLQFDGSGSTDSDGEIKRYAWNFGDGTSGAGVIVSHAFQKSGVYTVALRVEDDSDSPRNFNEDGMKVWINAPPIVEIGEDRISSEGESVTFDGGRSYDSDGNIVDYLWDFGDGTAGRGRIVEHTYDKPGKYGVTLTIQDNTDVENNSASDQLTVTVNDRPSANAGNDRRAAVGEVVQFDGSGSTDRDGVITDYRWQFGDGATAGGMKVSHAYDRPGEYIVTLTVQDNSTSVSDKDSDELTVIVNHPPVAEAGEDMVVTSSDVRFDGMNSKDEDGTIVRYLWDFGDGAQSSDASPIHVYGNPGTYLVKLTVTDDSGTSTCQTSNDLTVIVNQAPVADAGVDRVGALGQVLTFNGSLSLDSDGQVSDYVWDFGDGETASGVEVTHAYESPGTYTVRLTVRDNTGHLRAIDHDEVIATINAPPVADAGMDICAAPGQTVTFDGKGSYDIDGEITFYEWRFSDGLETAESVMTKRAFPESGVYSATLTIADKSSAINARSQDNVSVYINHEPIARPGSDIRTCDATVQFSGSTSADADGDPLTYIWDFGDGTAPATGVTVLHTYAQSGSYPVVLTIDDGTGLANSKNSASITILINAPPVAHAGESRTICAGDVVLFDGGGSIDPEGGLLKYYWDFGDGTVAEGLNPTKIYKDDGVYQVTLTVKDDSDLPCNSDVDQIVVYVAESPVADVGPDQTVCANTVVQFDGSKSRDFDGVVNNFSWDFGDGLTGGGATPTHVYTKPGVYRVLLTITGDQIGQCDNSDSDELICTVVDAPVAKFSYDRLVPVNTDVVFDASESSSEVGEIVGYEWDFGDGNTGTGERATHIFNTPGKYFVKLTVRTDSETECNAAHIQDYIIVNGTPTADAGENQLAGMNQMVVFNGLGSKDLDGSVVAYAWDFGDGNTASGVEVRHQYRTSGQFAVTLKVMDNSDLENNWDVDTVTVSVNAAPIPVIECVDWACVGRTVAFNGLDSRDPDGTIVKYHWDFGDGQRADSVQTAHVYHAPGRYDITLTVDDGSSLLNSVSTVSRTLMINHPPSADAGQDRIVCPGDAVTFDGSGSMDRDGKIIQYLWDFGDEGRSEGERVNHVYEKPGRYRVLLRVQDDSGTESRSAEDSLAVIVNSAPVAVAGPDQEAFCGGAHDAVLFDGTKSYDPDGDPLVYFWDFGDGSTMTGAKVSHAYVKLGTYTVRLRVRDGSGSACGEVWDELTVEVKRR